MQFQATGSISEACASVRDQMRDSELERRPKSQLDAVIERLVGMHSRDGDLNVTLTLDVNITETGFTFSFILAES